MIKKNISEYLLALKDVIGAFPKEKLEEIIRVMEEAYQNERQIFVFGNGGSGATASHFACDMNKCASVGRKKRFKVICLNDNIPMMLACANDMAYEDIFVEQLKNFLKAGDVVIGISGSGNSPNVLKAIEYAGCSQAVTIGFTGFDGGQLAKIASIACVIPVHDMQKVEDLHLTATHIIMRSVLKIK